MLIKTIVFIEIDPNDNYIGGNKEIKNFIEKKFNDTEEYFNDLTDLLDNSCSYWEENREIIIEN